MANFKAMAERELRRERPGEASQRVKIAIGFPAEQADGDWACPVAAEGLFDKLPAMRGVDAWQALMLARRLLLFLLFAEVEKGATFHWPCDGAEVNVRELFAEPAGVSFRLLVLRTRQAERLCAFYRSLGVALSEERHGNGPLHYAGRMGEAVLEVYPLADEDGPGDTTTRLGFAVAGLGRVLEALKLLGTSVIQPPKATIWGVRAVVRDPDGRAVELYEGAEAGNDHI